MVSVKQKEVLAGKILDLGNISVGSLVFGFVVRSELFSGFSLVLGLVIAVAAYSVALRFLRQ